MSKRRIKTTGNLPVPTLCTIFLMWRWHAECAVATENTQNITDVLGLTEMHK